MLPDRLTKKLPSMTRIAFLALFLCIAAFALIRSPDNKLQADIPEIVEAGQIIYKDQCASCHGVNLEGQANWRYRKPDGKLPAPPHDKSGHTWHHSDAALIKLTKFGPMQGQDIAYETDMPAYQDILSDKEIIAVLSYIKSTWPDNIRQHQDALTIKNP